MNNNVEYVGCTYTYRGDMRWAIENEQNLMVEVPKDLPVESTSATDKKIWEKRIDEFVKRDIKLNENCKILYSLILGQCIDYMRAKLESLIDYEKMNGAFDVITHIKSIKGLTYQFEGQ
jgi:hypothetical protein